MTLAERIVWCHAHGKTAWDFDVAEIETLLHDRDRLAEKVAFQARQLTQLWATERDPILRRKT